MPAFDSPPQPEVRAWPGEQLTRVPYWVYHDEDTLAAEQRLIFEGPAWHYACLESDIPERGDYRTTQVGQMPVIVVRGDNGEIHAFENRCAHRGALIALDDAGKVDRMFRCVYHAWSYDLAGNLKGIAFEKGVAGVGGMKRDVRREPGVGPRKLRTTTLCGLVFVTLSPDTPPLEQSLGDVLDKLRRVLNRPIRVMGRFTQSLPANWKHYAENVRDTYHASLLHSFFPTFRINRLTQGGGIVVSPDGAHHASATIERNEGTEASAYRDQQIKSERTDYKLADPRLLDSVDEFGDEIRLQILSVFPAFVMQQVHNCLALRQVVPRGTDRADLHWTYFGFEDDPPEMYQRRLRQQNLVGPAGYVSMEDGCAIGFVQRGTAQATGQLSVIEMGGDGTESQATRATEAAVRGFWKTWRRYMGQ